MLRCFSLYVELIPDHVSYCLLVRLMIICGGKIFRSELLRSLSFSVYRSLPEAVYHRFRQQKWKRKHNLLLTAAQLLFLDAL